LPKTGGTLSGNLRIDNSASTAVRLQLNNTGSNDYASIYADTASAYKNLILNPLGGNVGIGTSSPSGTKKLHVYSGDSGASDYGVPGLAIENDTNVSLQLMGGASHQLGITFSDSGATEAGYIYYNTGTQDLTLKVEDDVIFKSGTAETMRIDSSGNVGIDVTPSAHSSTYRALQIGSVGSIFSHASATGDGSTFFGSNIYNNSGWKYITTNEASFIQQKNGEFYFARAASGSAGAAATLSYPFVINSSGNVGIGTDGPSRQLTVQNSSDHAIIGAVSGTSNLAGMVMGDTSDDDRGAVLYNNNGDYMYFQTDTAERMRIDSSGRVGLGSQITSNQASTYDSRSNDFVISGGGNTGMTIAGGSTEDIRLVFTANGTTGLSKGSFTYDNANDTLAIETGGSQRIRIDSDGLKFGSDTAAANALDDYEEGTWTPTITTGSGSITLDSGENLASYTKIGRMVYITGRLLASSVSSPSGSLEVTNLPFTVLNLGENTPSSPVVINLYNLAANIDGQINAEMSTGNSILIRDNGGTTGNVQNSMASHIGNGSRIGFTAVYVTSQ
jgi:hypothetical protein